MKEIGLEWVVIDDAIQFKEISTPATPKADKLKLYAKDNGSGVSQLFYKNDAGTEIGLPVSGSFVTGTGAAGRVTYWDSANTITSDVNFLWDATNKKLTVQGAGTGTVLQVTGSSNSMVTISENTVNSQILITLGAAGQTNGVVNTPESMRFNIDSNNDQTNREFGIYKDSASNGGTLLWKVVEGGSATLGAGAGQLSYIVDSAASTFSGYRIDRASAEKWFLGMTNSGVEEFVIRRGAATNDISISTAGLVTVNTILDALTGFRVNSLAGAGKFLRGDGTNIVLSTPTLPNAATANRILYATGSNAWGESADLAFDGTDFLLGSSIRARMSGQNRFRYLNSEAAVYQSSAQTGIAVNTWTAITFNAEEFDTDSIHSTVSNTSRLVAGLTGKYLVGGSIYRDVSGVVTITKVAMAINVNQAGTFGGNIYGYMDFPIVSTDPTDPGTSTSSLISLTAGDYVELFGYTSGASGTWATSTAGGAHITRFWMVYVGE